MHIFHTKCYQLCCEACFSIQLLPLEDSPHQHVQIYLILNRCCMINCTNFLCFCQFLLLQILRFSIWMSFNISVRKDICSVVTSAAIDAWLWILVFPLTIELCGFNPVPTCLHASISLSARYHLPHRQDVSVKYPVI